MIRQATADVTRSGTLLKAPWRGYRCLQCMGTLGIDFVRLIDACGQRSDAARDGVRYGSYA